MRNRGFIRTIIVVIVALAILKFVFHVDLKDILDSKIVSTIVSIIKTLLKMLWNAILLGLNFIKALLITAKNFLEGLNA